MSALQNENPHPLVTVVTPVYNGERYLRACIESVLAQTYTNWELVIVNNGSTDSSLDIAREYARRDSRVRVRDNEEFLPIIDNHNVAIAALAPESVYCKPLMADDWLYSDCLATMVAAAQRSPAAGLVCCYAFDGTAIRWEGLTFSGDELDPVSVVSGREICRATLLGGPYVFGNPTSCLIRSDLIRKRSPFYNRMNLHADHESCYDVLTEADFGFVHRVLVFNRAHPESQSTAARASGSFALGDLTALVTFGPRYLTDEEYARRHKERFFGYYRLLGKNVFRADRGFWDAHRKRLAELGYRLETSRIAIGFVAEAAKQVLGRWSAAPIGLLFALTPAVKPSPQARG